MNVSAREIACSGIAYYLGRLEGMADGARYSSEETLREIVRTDLPQIAAAIRDIVNGWAAGGATPADSQIENATPGGDT